MSIQHTVLFWWQDTAAPEDVEKLSRALDTLPAQIPEILTYRHGRDIGVRDGNADYAVVATFADRDAVRLYFEHPDHLHIIATLVTPMVATKAAVQFETN